MLIAPVQACPRDCRAYPYLVKFRLRDATADVNGREPFGYYSHESSILSAGTKGLRSSVMKIVECSYAECGGRRRHHEEPYEPRGVRHIEVPDDHMGPMFCSLECAAYAGMLKVSRVDDLNRIAEDRKV